MKKPPDIHTHALMLMTSHIYNTRSSDRGTEQHAHAEVIEEEGQKTVGIGRSGRRIEGAVEEEQTRVEGESQKVSAGGRRARGEVGWDGHAESG